MPRVLSPLRCVFRQIYSTYWLLCITLSDYSFALCSFFKIWSHGNYIHEAPTATRPLFLGLKNRNALNHKNKFKSLADFIPSLSAWRFSIRKGYWSICGGGGSAPSWKFNRILLRELFIGTSTCTLISKTEYFLSSTNSESKIPHKPLWTNVDPFLFIRGLSCPRIVFRYY